MAPGAGAPLKGAVTQATNGHLLHQSHTFDESYISREE